MIPRFVKYILKLLFLLSLLLSVAAYVAVSYFKPVLTEVGGINAKSKRVNLWKAPTVKSSVVGKLRSGEFATLFASRHRWNNFYKINRDQIVLKKDFKIGYSRVFKQFIVRTKVLKQYEERILKFSPWVIVSLLGLFLLLLVLRFFSFISGRKKLSSGSQDDVDIQNDYLEENRRLAFDKKVSEEVENERRKLIREFEDNAKKEIKRLERSTNTDIALRKKTYENLKLEYDEAVERARVLGIDLEGSNIDGLVKGRLFELFAAKIWDESDDITIEDWTSDKGIFEGVYVKSNGNPDFLLSFGGNEVAVECKYREKSYYLAGGDGELCLPLDEKTVIARYYGYKKKKDIEVFLLFGTGGTAEEPESLYLISIGECYNTNTAFRYEYKGNERFAAKLSRLEKYKIEKHELIEYVKAGM